MTNRVTSAPTVRTFAPLFPLYLTDGFVGGLPLGEGDKRVAPVESGHGVHHEPEVPDGAALLEQRDQLVLVQVTRDLSTKNLRRGTVIN